MFMIAYEDYNSCRYVTTDTGTYGPLHLADWDVTSN